MGKSHFNKLSLYRFLLALTPISGDKNFSSSWYKESTFHVGILFSNFRKKKEGHNTLASALFQNNMLNVF